MATASDRSGSLDDDAPAVQVIVGPTASGKTAAAIEAALAAGGEVISADSRCLYRGLDIGTAKPTPAERRGVVHHFVDELDLGQPYAAGRFARDAEARIGEIRARGATPIVAGGSTLYVDALVRGLAEMPEVPPDVRQALVEEHARGGLEPLVEDLRRLDPVLAARIDLKNPARVLRGLEVVRASGLPLSTWQTRRVAPRYRYDVRVLRLGREELDRRIDARVEAMVAAGWLDEVRALLDAGVSAGLEPLRTIGYREMVEVVRGERTLDEAVRLVQQRTRQYARRQVRYFDGYFATPTRRTNRSA